MTLLITREDITARALEVSITEKGQRLDTVLCRYPRIVHADLMTHRVFSRNASSSRAIPTVTMLERDKSLFIPNFRHNKPGMQPGEYLAAQQQAEAEAIWTDMANYVAEGCRVLAEKHGLNIAKQWTNRPLEWFGYIDVLISSTDWENFDYLRDHEAAQDEIQLLAIAINETRDAAKPKLVRDGQWHRPFITDHDYQYAHTANAIYLDDLASVFDNTLLRQIDPADKLLLIESAARACRLSYSKLDGSPTTAEDDIQRFKKLVPVNAPVHASPLEHQATPLAGFPDWAQGNFRGWAQFRKLIPNEAVTEK